MGLHLLAFHLPTHRCRAQLSAQPRALTVSFKWCFSYEPSSFHRAFSCPRHSPDSQPVAHCGHVSKRCVAPFDERDRATNSIHRQIEHLAHTQSFLCTPSCARIEDGNGGIKYELCLSHDHEEDEDEHVHFFCEQCHRTFCLRETPLPTLTLPADYLVLQVQLVVKGICPACRTKGKARL